MAPHERLRGLGLEASGVEPLHLLLQLPRDVHATGAATDHQDGTVSEGLGVIVAPHWP